MEKVVSNTLIYKVGVYSKGHYLSSVDGKHTREYNSWISMLSRCYSEKFHERCPTYLGCSVSENFKNFQYFAEWCQDQIGGKSEGWHLDKDILYKGNKIYSEDTCVFVPRELNMLLVNRKASRGAYPVGVDYHKATKKFRAKLTVCGKSSHIGIYDTPEEAYIAYKSAKQSHLTDQANRYKPIIDRRVYEALIMWEGSIDD